jgi:uncharacterized protein (TIGR01777 family)
MRIAVTGSTGLIGTALREYFGEAGHDVTQVVRSGVGPGRVRWDPVAGTIDAAGLEAQDVVVHLAGESIAGVWTDAKKRRIRESRVRGTALLARTLASLRSKPKVLISASAVGIYGSRPASEVVTEATPPGTGFLAEVVQAWEAATAAAVEAGIRVVLLRTGNVLSPRGGMLEALLPVFRLGLGGRLGDGEQVWTWIALDDIPPIVEHVIERDSLTGPVNAVAPSAVTNAEFTRVLAEVLGRPAFFHVPAFAAKLAPGGMAEEILLAGARVEPRRLTESGYAFRYRELRAALIAMLRRG